MVSSALAAGAVTANARVSETIDPLIIERMELGFGEGTRVSEAVQASRR